MESYPSPGLACQLTGGGEAYEADISQCCQPFRSATCAAIKRPTLVASTSGRAKPDLSLLEDFHGSTLCGQTLAVVRRWRISIRRPPRAPIGLLLRGCLLWALVVLMVSGLLVLLTRTTVVFGPILVVHLAAVIVAFGIMPYTKFVHWTYRVLAVYKDNLERTGAQREAAAV